MEMDHLEKTAGIVLKGKEIASILLVKKAEISYKADNFHA